MDEDFLQDLFEAVGPISIRNMFGGQGIYADGVIIAVVVNGQLMIKGDADVQPTYEAAGMARWTYENAKTRRTSSMPYWAVPESAFDDADEMAKWANAALHVGQRAKSK